MAFYIGQRVQCVDASSGVLTGHRDLVEGRVYVVEGFDPESPNSRAIYLVGVPKRPLHGFEFPCGWNPQRFRPITERKTDISLFKAMLNPSKQERQTVR